MKDVCNFVNLESINERDNLNVQIKIIKSNDEEIKRICNELCAIYKDVLDELAK